MLQKNIASNLLNCAAILVAIAIPSLIFGRALIGVTLGLAFLIILISTDPRNTIAEIKNTLSPQLSLLLGLTIITSAINIPFSIRADLSFEAWARTWLLVGILAFISFSLKDKLGLILKILTISCLLVLLAYFLNESPHLKTTKLLLNALMLIMPIVLYQCFIERKPIWISIGVINLSLFLYWALEKTSKTSIAGLAIIVLTYAFFLSASRLSIKKAVLISSIIFLLILIGLSFWLPSHVYAFSSENIGASPFPVWLIDLHRQLIWIFSFELFQESPWVGYGLNASNYHPAAEQDIRHYFSNRFPNLTALGNTPALPAHPHNWLMEMLLDSGLIATLTLLGLIGFILISSVRSYLQNKHTALLTFIVINLIYWVTGLLNFSFWSTWWQASFYLSSMLMLTLYLRDKKDRSVSEYMERTGPYR